MFGRVSVRKRLEAGQVQYGLFVTLGNPAVVEAAGHVGYEVLLFDQEHSPYDFVNAIHCMNAARGTDSECWVRIPANDSAYVKRILDCGADGVMCPMINTATDAERFVRSCRYPPHGFRGYAPTVARMTSYGYRREEYFRRIDSDLAIMVQIETEEAVRHAGDIAAVDGVNIVFIGPMDLSMNLGYPGQTSHPVVTDALRHVEEAVRQRGKSLGTIVTPGQDAKVLIERGYRFIVPAGDIGLLRAGMEAQMKTLREARDNGRSA